ncbi:hypothetical protein Daesc_008427 [Daldinia eschscholtzii]|uniref:Uncharacterized protein n=1 Tax=Daldinia eschscholtzii TaxID=292717 RepID=A0AAX6MD42_9PEZI
MESPVQFPQPRPDDKDVSDDDTSYNEEDLVTLESVQQRMTINLPIVSNYASHWSPIAAFRELVQNWRDGMIKSFDIPEDNFHVTRSEYGDEIVFRAIGSRRDASGKMEEPVYMGYIRWFKQNGVGTVEVTNRQATLQPWHLDIGGTTKRDEPNQAGAHGEGLKVALLVLMRGPQNHAIHCRSGGFAWEFDYTNQRRLVAGLTRMTPATIEKFRSQAINDMNSGRVPIAASPSDDVQFFISGDSMGRNENGRRTMRNQVTKNEFTEWTRSALFLQKIHNDEIVRTGMGDLILDARFRGSIYLKGLLLKESQDEQSASITGKPLMYGYNFAAGVANPEREFLTHAAEELNAILRIWDQALRFRGSLAAEFHELLDSEEPEFADVSQAENCLSLNMRQGIKAYVLREFGDKWLYAIKEKCQNIRFDHIVQGLGREPLEIKDSYWTILRSCGFRTAEEEEKRQFLAAEPVRILETDFAHAVDRFVQASLDSCPYVANSKLEFIKAGSVGLDSFYSPQHGLFKVHEKWLTAEGARDELGISANIPQSSLLFHTATRLFADAVAQVPLDKFYDGIHSPHWYQKRAVSQGNQRILECLQIQQDLQYMVERGEKSDMLMVRWNPFTGWFPDTSVDVQFHLESTCASMKHCPMSGNVNPHMDSFIIFSDQRTPVPEVSSPSLAAMANPMVSQNDPTSDGRQTFLLRDRIDSLDIMAPRAWFSGINSVGTQAVVGIASCDTFRTLSDPSPVISPTCNWVQGEGSSNGSPRHE